MPHLIAKLRRAGSESEAEAFLRESHPFPVVAIALGGLALGDVAVVLAMLANTGWSH